MTQSGKHRESNVRNHDGTAFTVWSRRHIWFWLLRDRYGNSLAIGTAATEAEAVGEAHASIEELASQHLQLASSCGSGAKAVMPEFNRSHPPRTALSWMNWWMSVAHHGTGKMLNCSADIGLRSS